MRKVILHITILLCATFQLHSQNLEKIGKKDMITVGGGLNYNGIFYNADGIQNRRPPYSWFFNGNLNINILDVSLPFSYSYSNLSSNYTQPFNMTSCAPSYKWIKTYMGYTSMNFSNYSLAGHIFLGGGVDLTPGNWKISAMYGRLNKAVEYDAVNQSDALMSYKRMGYGAKVGYEKDGHGLNLIYFSAKDDPNSLHFVPSNSAVLPQENTVISASAKTKLFSILTIQGEYALSGLTRNLNGESYYDAEQKNPMPLFFNPKSSSQFFSAYKSSIGFSKSVFSLNFNYEHIDPNYKTLGAYFFNNDLENITIAPSLRLLKGKLNLSANTGYQHNNLDKTKFSLNKRFVSSGNLNYAPSSKFIFNVSYSNFTSFTRVRPVTDPYYQRSAADTLNFYQISQSANSSITYNFGGTSIKNTITLIGSYQVSNQKQGNTTAPAMTVLNGNLNYTMTFVKSKISAGLNANYNQMQSFANTTTYMGPGITLGKSFFKNTLRFNLSNTFNQSLTNSEVTALVLSERASISFTPKTNKKYGKPSISLNAMYTDKFATTQQQKAFKEFTGMVNLNYSF
ncbi:MAG: hypothetical protein ACXVC6_07565 [Bacteroidia bacterium]